MDDSIVIVVYILGGILGIFIMKALVSWFHEIEKRNRLMVAQIKLLAEIAGHHGVAAADIQSILKGAQIYK